LVGGGSVYLTINAVNCLDEASCRGTVESVVDARQPGITEVPIAGHTIYASDQTDTYAASGRWYIAAELVGDPGTPVALDTAMLTGVVGDLLAVVDQIP
jgi:hypothetical protein